MRKKKVTVIGGGTGLPVLLREFKKQNVEITAVVTVADDGGSSGIIRDYVNIVPPGDIRNCLVALSNMPPVLSDIFQYRFDSSDQFLAGHAIGNFVIAALTEMKGNIFDAIQELSALMKVDGKVYAVSHDPLVLHAEYVDGTTVTGESEIAKHRKRIRKVHITTQDGSIEDAKASDEVIQSIMEADMIVLGPGSLFTSILPNLMIPNVAKAIQETKAQVVYICNIMTQQGETESFSDADHVRVLHRHLGNMFVDTVLVNTEPVPQEYVDSQNTGKAYLYPVRHYFQGLVGEGCRVISDNFLKMTENGAYHNGEKVIAELMRQLYTHM